MILPTRNSALSRLGLLPILAIACSAAQAQGPPRMTAGTEMFRAPKAEEAADFRAEGMRAVFHEGMPWKGKPTRVFAWIGIPPVEPGRKVPGMVLVHGGGGTAFADWVKLWVDRGYAAIAMDTCGAVPKGTYGKWERHEQGGPPGWGGLDQLGEPIGDQWAYHAIADVLLANSLLREQPGVDPDRIGLTGISWGGYLTCIASGLDDRFRFAAPVYGCGFLGEESAWSENLKKLGPVGQEWLRLWDPSHFLPSGKMPKLWVTGTNDFAFPMPALKQSYEAAGGDSTLCIRLRMPHGHNGPGEKPPEILAFADAILRDGRPMARIRSHGKSDGLAWATFEGGSIAKAELLFTKETGPWTKRTWEAVPAEVDPQGGKASAPLPQGTTAWFLNVIDGEGRVVSSPHEEVAAR